MAGAIVQRFDGNALEWALSKWVKGERGRREEEGAERDIEDYEGDTAGSCTTTDLLVVDVLRHTLPSSLQG